MRVTYNATATSSVVKDASAAANALLTLSHFTVVNGTADSTAPTLTSATVDSNAVRLNFSEALQTTDTLTNQTFEVEKSTDGGTNWSSATYTVLGNSNAYTNSGSTVMLTLDSAVADETQMRVTYNATAASSLVTDASNAENALSLIHI